MMDTPILDFVRQYQEKDVLRLHMPGHKGTGPLGAEGLDITEVLGADSLYEAEGIIRKSEENASRLFGCPTCYSTEGASHCIRAMLHLATAGKAPVVAAGRNVHKAFLTGAALLDLQVRWVYPSRKGSYLSCQITPEDADRFLQNNPVSALYVTSPDYLGNMADIQGLSQVCHKHGIPLLVDNAHGAYLRFLTPSRHPVDLGADMCCSSAHKTLPVLTGGAYLHIAPGNCHGLRLRNDREIKNALALFGSTSPSYLILQSLDMANRILSEDYRQELSAFAGKLEGLKEGLVHKGWTLVGEDPLRLTVQAKPAGYTGSQLGDMLRQQGMECEFSDPDYLVLMLNQYNGAEAISRLERFFDKLPLKPPIHAAPPEITAGEQVMSVRKAMLSETEYLPVENAVGRILAQPSVGCPPAVPIVICGERITPAALECFRYYGVTHCWVVG